MCTAGITEDGKWIRLYPVPFRYLEYGKQYPKFSWIRVKVKKPSNDHRPDSFKIDAESIEITHKLGTSLREWSERNGIIVPTVSPSLEYLIEQQSTSKYSLGIFKPKTIIDLEYIPNKNSKSSRVNKNEFLSQLGIFDEKPPSDLEPMTYNFYFTYICDDPNCSKVHRTLIIDWEIFAAFRRFKRQYGEARALAAIRDKYLKEVCGPARDTYFIVGTDHRFNNFMIIGVYWPPANLTGQISLIH